MSSGSCEPISNIFVPEAFQWYKIHLNSMSFDTCTCSLKIWKSIRTPTPNMGVHLGVWEFFPSHSLHSQEHEMGLSSLVLARTLASLCLGREPKARVATTMVYGVVFNSNLDALSCFHNNGWKNKGLRFWHLTMNFFSVMARVNFILLLQFKIGVHWKLKF